MEKPEIIIGIFIGLFLIGFGFIVKASPGIISGYNTMPKEKKEKVDIVGFSKFVQIGFIILGIKIIILPLFVNLFNLNGKILAYVSLSITLIIVIFLVIIGQKFNGNRKNE